ncbi:MAG TPA: hemerythrin domain-containing protein [Burkholderiaceae bacterium]
MSVLDKVVAAITPTESEDKRRSARRKAEAAAANCDWLRLVLAHHRAIEDAFAQLAAASDANGRRRAQKWLATLLNGHSMGEEAVIYPAMALGDQKAHATTAYTEQSGAKVNLAALETMDPMSQDYIDKFEHVRGAVMHHMYSEEDDWLVDLARTEDPALHARLGARYAEEFDRYMGPDATMP